MNANFVCQSWTCIWQKRFHSLMLVLSCSQQTFVRRFPFLRNFHSSIKRHHPVVFYVRNWASADLSNQLLRPNSDWSHLWRLKCLMCGFLAQWVPKVTIKFGSRSFLIKPILMRSCLITLHSFDIVGLTSTCQPVWFLSLLERPPKCLCWDKTWTSSCQRKVRVFVGLSLLILVLDLTSITASTESNTACFTVTPHS